MQYIVAVPMIFGRLVAADYEDFVASDPRIDALRAKMTVREDPRYTSEYLELDKRSIANAVQVFFRDGTSTPLVEVEYPIGHRRRRRDGIPLLVQKFRDAMLEQYSPAEVASLADTFLDLEGLQRVAASDLMARLAR